VLIVVAALALVACGSTTSTTTSTATTAAPTTAAPSPSISGAARQADAALCSELAVNPGQAIKTAGAVSPGLATLVGKWGFDSIGGASRQTMTDDVNEVMAWCESNGFNVLGSDPHPLAVMRALGQGVSHVRVRSGSGLTRGAITGHPRQRDPCPPSRFAPLPTCGNVAGQHRYLESVDVDHETERTVALTPGQAGAGGGQAATRDAGPAQVRRSPGGRSRPRAASG
jgi:hypothetical protein